LHLDYIKSGNSFLLYVLMRRRKLWCSIGTQRKCIWSSTILCRT